MGGFEGYTGEYVGHVVVKASMTLGDDPRQQSVSFPMEGSVRIREWPSEGYERRTLDDGRTQIDLEMVESHIEGQVAMFEEAIHITETTANRNLGTLTQQVAGQDFPAVFELARLVAVDTPIGRLHNEEPIRIRALLHDIPPIADAEAMDGPNVFEAVNTPVPLLNEAGEVVGYFSGSPDERSNCVVRMVSAEAVGAPAPA
jgi:hypothetical protein